MCLELRHVRYVIIATVSPEGPPLKKLLPWLLGKKTRDRLDNSVENMALIERLKVH